MTNDRELLELAAKAAGIVLEYEEEPDRYFYRRNPYNLIRNGQSLKGYWNPLTDDGDALRLAVKLRHELGTDVAQCFGIGRFDEYKNDPLAATRRAIVRAAAEIGRSMK